LSPYDCSHEERPDEQVVNEGEIDVGVELSSVDTALEDLPYRGPARRQELVDIGVGQFGVVGQIRDQSGRDPTSVGSVPAARSSSM
jgi:hypothetical protein